MDRIPDEFQDKTAFVLDFLSNKNSYLQAGQEM